MIDPRGEVLQVAERGQRESGAEQGPLVEENHLPAFLRQAAPALGDELAIERPKRAPRRRKPASFEDGDGNSSGPSDEQA